MLANWTKATTTTTGTGTITLAAVTGRPLPSKSRTTGEYVQYSIVTSDSKYESGIGKIAASDTLERSKVFSTYDGTTYNSTTATALSLASGTHTVYITPIAEGISEPWHFPLSGPTNASVFQSNLTSTQANVSTAAAQRPTVFPYKLEVSGVLTSMGIYCSVLGASSTTLLGMYEMETNGRPGRLIAKTSATLDTSTTGWKTQAVVSNVRLNAGWYWAAVCVTAGTNPQFTGALQLAGPTGGSGRDCVGNIRYDSTGTDLSDPFQTTSLVYAYSNNTYAPYIGLIMS